MVLSDETGDGKLFMKLNVEVSLPVVKVAQSSRGENDRTRLMSFEFLKSNRWTEAFEPECKMLIILIRSDFNYEIFLKLLTFVELTHFFKRSNDARKVGLREFLFIEKFCDLIQVLEKDQAVTHFESIDGLLWEFRIGDCG